MDAYRSVKPSTLSMRRRCRPTKREPPLCAYAAYAKNSLGSGGSGGEAACGTAAVAVAAAAAAVAAMVRAVGGAGTTKGVWRAQAQCHRGAVAAPGALRI